MIPFNRPVQLEGTLESIGAAFRSGQTAGVGPIGNACEMELARLLGAPCLLVSSCTHALEMSALLLGISPGDEVILPAFTFVSTANAFVLRGARPVFADVDTQGNIDVEQVRRLRTPRTRAVCVVHYAGNSCDMAALLDACGPVPLVEDAAQAIQAHFRGRPLGSLGAVGAISFHETKNIGCGEGGALVLPREDLRERAEWIREKGTNRRQFSQGLVDKYTWVDVGSSYVLSEINAAYLRPQLEALPRIQERRQTVFRRYLEALSGPAERAGVRWIEPPAHNDGNAHLFALVFRNGDQRSQFITRMRGHGILTPFHYVALHRSPMGARFHDGRHLPRSEQLSDALVRLPLFFNLVDSDVDEVIGRTVDFLRGL